MGLRVELRASGRVLFFQRGVLAGLFVLCTSCIVGQLCFGPTCPWLVSSMLLCGWSVGWEAYRGIQTRTTSPRLFSDHPIVGMARGDTEDNSVRRHIEEFNAWVNDTIDINICNFCYCGECHDV